MVEVSAIYAVHIVYQSGSETLQKRGRGIVSMVRATDYSYRSSQKGAMRSL